jgi:long-chain acyl-CoA synthetase
MIGVPAIWETVKKEILAMVSASSAESQSQFWYALESKKKTVSEGHVFSTKEDDVAFDKARSLLGGRLRFMLTGGGPIAENTQEFISFVIAPLINGFGLTETMA